MSFADGNPALFAVSAGLDGLIGALALWSNLPFGRFIANTLAALEKPEGEKAARVLRVSGVASAVFLTSLCFGFKLIPLRMLGVNFFGLIHLLYLDLVVVIPALALIVLIGLRGRAFSATPAVRGLACMALLLIPVGLFSTFIEPFRLQTEHASIEVAAGRAGHGAFTIGVLADLQTDRITQHEQNAVERLMALQPDLILLPGDLFQGTQAEFESQLPALRQLLDRLNAPGGVFFVTGDVDNDSEERARLARAIQGTRIRLLDDEITELTVGDRKVTIGGVGLRYDSPSALETIRKLESLPGSDDIRILLAHRPDAVFQLSPDSRVDLLICGHTHGGQVQLPLFGPPIIASNVPRRVGAGGLHQIKGNTIYVSRGVGWERNQAPRIRLLCPPEISLLTVGR